MDVWIYVCMNECRKTKNKQKNKQTNNNQDKQKSKKKNYIQPPFKKKKTDEQKLKPISPKAPSKHIRPTYTQAHTPTSHSTLQSSVY